MIFIGLIPAKGRSRGLPGKNITELIGKPLVAWSIEAALRTKTLNTVFVSTENAEIGAISRSFGAQVVQRPNSLCGDDTTTEAVIAHAIPQIKKLLKNEDFCIVLLQPTSPLRTANDIDKAVKMFDASDANAMVSVYRVESTLLKVYRQNADGFLTGAFGSDAPYLPRQSLPEIFMPNGAIYIFTASNFVVFGGIPRTKVLPFFMEKERSIDIDTLADLNKVKKIMEKNHGNFS